MTHSVPPAIARIIGAVLLVAAPFTVSAADDDSKTPETGVKTTVEVTPLDVQLEDAVSPGIGRLEARSIARRHLRQLGFTDPGRSMLTAKITDLTRVGDEYKAGFRFGSHLPTKQGLLTIHAKTGKILQSPFTE